MRERRRMKRRREDTEGSGMIARLLPARFTALTSRPKASNGQQLPCPAFIGLDIPSGSRAAAPIGDKVLLNVEIRTFPPLGPPARAEAQPARP